jgi:hypothetical protein
MSIYEVYVLIYIYIKYLLVDGKIGADFVIPLLKAAADGVALLFVLPVVLLYRLGRTTLGAERAFSRRSQAFALVPCLSGVYLRRAFCRLALARYEPGCCVSFGTVISHPTAEFGRDVYIGAYS